MRIAVVGATGMVGREMLKVLDEEQVAIDELIPVASASSIGQSVSFKGKQFKVIGIDQALAMRPDVALFSAGGSTSTEWARKFANMGSVVIDNSSAWRMDPNVPLVVPEVNFSSIEPNTKLIANPNCSTIQLVMALYPLHKVFGIERVVVSTYQSVTGTGKNAVQQLEDEERGIKPAHPAYAHPIHRNCIPHCDVFLENGYTKEEMKLVHESRKIMGIPNLKLTATAVRVPVIGGHSESVNVSFKKEARVEQIRSLLEDAEGIQVVDDPSVAEYPMPFNSHNKNAVLVGRIRADESTANAFNLWIVADNLRKGAATNAVQILERLIGANWFNDSP